MRVGILQMTSSDDPSENTKTVLEAMDEASGVDLLVTPEVTNCVSMLRAHQHEVLRREVEDPCLHAVRDKAAALGLPVLLGSIAVKTDEPRFANRSVLVGPDGGIVARYDKAHMFDVTVSETETYRESDGYRPGTESVLAKVGDATLGLTICYDVRFAYLYRALAQAGAQILTVPSAFSPVTGAAHWEVLLRARAIETGCYVLAPAQTGDHAARVGKRRSTFGHSLVVAPWGEVILDAGIAPGLHFVDLDLGAVDEARRRVPSLTHDAVLEGPS